ncbi:MAG: transcription antitermination factor NusB [Kiloniellaceae bacterium]
MSGSSPPGAARAFGRRAASSPRRSAARLAATQALYQIEMAGGSAEAVLREFLDHRVGEEVDGLRLPAVDRAMLGDLIKGVVAARKALDDMLAAVLEADWPVERLETLLRVVLRAGAYELSERPDVPARVIVTEYVDLAHAFFSGKEPGLVNGVLDRLARALRTEEFAQDGPPAAKPEPD